MKYTRCLFALLYISFLAGCVSPPEPAKPVDVGPPIDAPAALDGAMLTLTVSDLHGFLDGAGTVVSRISPMMSGPMLKTLLGSKIGDPQLTGFAPSNGVAVVMLNPTNGFAVAEVQAAQMQSTIETLKSMGLAAKEQEGLLLFAKNAEGFSSAEALAVTVQQDLLEAKREPTLRLSMKPSALLAENEKAIAAGLQQMVNTMEQSSGPEEMVEAQKILEAEVQVLLSIGRQVDSMEIDLVPAGGAIRLNKTVQPVAGSRLAAYCNAPAVKDYDPQIQPGMLPDGAMKVEYCVRNPDALLALLNGELENLSRTMGLDPAVAAQWSEYLSRQVNSFGTTACQSIFTKGDSGLGFSVLEDVQDEELALDTFRSMASDMESVGVPALYESMGMPLTVEFKENVRKAGGVSVHRLNMDFSLENMPADQREFMEALMGAMSFDIAVCNDVLIYTSTEGRMNSLVEQIKSGTMPTNRLNARAVFPEGAFYYADFDIGSYFEFISSMTQSVPEAAPVFDQFTQMLADANPIVLSGYRNSGRLKFSSQIPADLLVRFAQFGQMMVVQAMQNKAPMPTEQIQEPAGPAPDGTLKLPDGSSVQISSHEGQHVVVLDFWASWCGPCRKGLPMVQTVADHFSGRNVAFYAVNLREDIDTVNTFFEDTGLSLPVALDDGTLSDAFGVTGIPHTVVIGKDGNIVAAHTGLAPDLDAKLTAEINSALSDGAD